MDEKRIQCLSKHQHVPIYLQPITSYSEILFGNCNFFPTPLHLTLPVGVIPLDDLRFLVGELLDGQATIWCKNIAEKLNPLSRVHARHRRQTNDRQTDLPCH